MSETAEIISPKDQFISRFSTSENGENEFLKELRQGALQSLENLEVPTSRQEYWKYTRVASWMKPAYNTSEASDSSDEDAFNTPGLDAYNLVFVNGHFMPERSNGITEGKVLAMPMSQAWKTQHALVEANLGQLANSKERFFVALNTALQQDGVFLHVVDNQVLDKPLRILQISTGEKQAVQARNLLVIGKNAQAKVIHRWENNQGSACFTNAVSEIFVGQDAVVEVCLLQKEGELNAQINNTFVQQAKGSTFSIFTISLSGKLLRNNLNIAVEGERCETNLNGLYLTTGDQHVDNHTLVDHIEPNCESNELYKGILNGRSTGVFNGKVFVRQAAQKTNAFQSNQNILLTDDADVNSKPELEIYADDVKCSHGSTTGQFDEEAVFYLRSRGIGEDSARKLLIKAFASDVLESMTIESLKSQIESYISDRYDNALT